MKIVVVAPAKAGAHVRWIPACAGNDQGGSISRRAGIDFAGLPSCGVHNLDSRLRGNEGHLSPLFLPSNIRVRPRLVATLGSARLDVDEVKNR
jgi:hypothetical protein